MSFSNYKYYTYGCKCTCFDTKLRNKLKKYIEKKLECFENNIKQLQEEDTRLFSELLNVERTAKPAKAEINRLTRILPDYKRHIAMRDDIIEKINRIEKEHGLDIENCSKIHNRLAQIKIEIDKAHENIAKGKGKLFELKSADEGRCTCKKCYGTRNYCPICYDEKLLYMVDCGNNHFFCLDCINEINKSINYKCPYCRCGYASVYTFV